MAAREVYIWNHCGKPRQGITYDLIKQTKPNFKYALRVCMRIVIFFVGPYSFHIGFGVSQ